MSIPCIHACACVYLLMRLLSTIRVASWWPGLTPILYFVNKAAGLGGRTCQWGGLVSIVQSIALPVTVQFFFFYIFFFLFSRLLIAGAESGGRKHPFILSPIYGHSWPVDVRGRDRENESERWRAWTYARREVDAVFDKRTTWTMIKRNTSAS